MHRKRSISLSLGIALIASVVALVTAPPALASSTITYSGRGVAFKGDLAGNVLGYADTLPLPSSGGVQSAGLGDAGLLGLAGSSLSATTVGQGDRTRTEASLGAFNLAAGADVITADFAMTRAMAVSGGTTPTLSGTTTVTGLEVNGTPVTVTGAANQTVSLPDGQLIINERLTTVNGGTGSITINALHVIINDDVADFTAASSSAGVSNGSSNCSSGSSPTSGGGWITSPSAAKSTFGIHGRATATGATGHVVFTDHDTGDKVTGPVTAYTLFGNTAVLSGPAQMNGSPAGNFNVQVQDNGEPGTTDTFSIATTGTPPFGEGGTLMGGNIQIHKMCK